MKSDPLRETIEFTFWTFGNGSFDSLSKCLVLIRECSSHSLSPSFAFSFLQETENGGDDYDYEDDFEVSDASVTNCALRHKKEAARLKQA